MQITSRRLENRFSPPGVVMPALQLEFPALVLEIIASRERR
jgi:hypothetical protein